MSETVVRREVRGPAWASAIGAAAFVFGALMMAAQGNELLAQAVLAPGSAAVRNVPVECRKDEAEQEGVSPAECELMVANVRAQIISRPPWFRGFQMTLALVGMLAAFASILVGLALVDFRPWAPRAAVMSFAVLAALDSAEFLGALYTGPMLRALYLWNLLLWLSIHLCLTAGALTGRRMESEHAAC